MSWTGESNTEPVTQNRKKNSITNTGFSFFFVVNSFTIESLMGKPLGGYFTASSPSEGLTCLPSSFQFSLSRFLMIYAKSVLYYPWTYPQCTVEQVHRNHGILRLSGVEKERDNILIKTHHVPFSRHAAVGLFFPLVGYWVLLKFLFILNF